MMMICRTLHIIWACTSSLGLVLFISWQMVHGHARWSHSSSRQEVSCKWPSPAKYKNLYLQTRSRWDVKWPSADTWEYDWLFSPAFRCHVHPHCLTTPHLYICWLDVINRWKNAVAEKSLKTLHSSLSNFLSFPLALDRMARKLSQL